MERKFFYLSYLINEGYQYEKSGKMPKYIYIIV